MWPNLSEIENYSNQSMVYQQNIVRIPQQILQDIQYRSNVAIVFKNNKKQIMAGSGVLISRDLVLTAAHNLYDKLQNEHYDNFRIYVNPNNIAEEYFECQSWRYPQQFETVSNSIKRLKYDYAIIKLKPNPKLKVKYNQFMPLSNPCHECLNAKKKQTMLLLTGFPLNYGDNYKNLDVQAGKKFVLNQYGQCGTDRIVEINSKKCKISYTISTEVGLSGCPIISNKCIIGIHSGSQDHRNSNLGRLIDDQMICNLNRWARQLNCQDSINTTTFFQQSCQHKDNHSEDLSQQKACDLSEQQEYPVPIESQIQFQQRYAVAIESQCLLQQKYPGTKGNEIQGQQVIVEWINFSYQQWDYSEIDNMEFVQLIQQQEESQSKQNQFSCPQNPVIYNCHQLSRDHQLFNGVSEFCVINQQKQEGKKSKICLQLNQNQSQNQNNSSKQYFEYSELVIGYLISQQQQSVCNERQAQIIDGWRIKPYQNKRHRRAIKKVSQKQCEYIPEHIYQQQENLFKVKNGFDHTNWSKLLEDNASLGTRFIIDVCKGMQNLDELEIDHRDLAVRNIVLFIEDQGQDQFKYLSFDISIIERYKNRLRFKIIDFGNACCYEDIEHQKTFPYLDIDHYYEQFLHQIWRKLKKPKQIQEKIIERQKYEERKKYLQRVIDTLSKTINN